MKKFIQIGSLLTMLVLSTSIATFAQTGFGTDVKIPFAFMVGDRSYEAGEYIIRLERLVTGSATLTIQDTKTDEVQRVLLNANGDAASGDIKLVFDTVGGKKQLTKVATPDRSYAVVKTSREKDAARQDKAGAADIGGGANLF
jgi:hypothetical protein